MIRHLVLGSVLAFAAPAIAAVPFVAGNTAASRGDHATAATSFEHQIADHGWSTNTLFDLGNAYASSGQRGRAILAYERALVLSPRDVAVVTNLAATRAAAGVAQPAPSGMAAELGRLSSDEWAWLAIAGALLAGLGASAWAWWPLQRSRSGAVGAVGTIGAVLAFSAAIVVAPARDVAVVVHSVAARIAPLASAEEAFAATEGETVHIAKRRADFLYVRDGDRAGWLPRSAAEPVLPERAPAHT
ncbi:hypothetical protein BH11MYX1_BH11MYX1_27010 [soil metagenome]